MFQVKFILFIEPDKKINLHDYFEIKYNFLVMNRLQHEYSMVWFGYTDTHFRHG